MALTTEEWERLVRRYRAVIIAQAKTTLEKHPDYLEPTGFSLRRCKHSGHLRMEPVFPTTTLSHWDDEGDTIMIDWDSLSSKRCVALFKEKKEEAKIPKGFRGFLGKEPWYARYK